VQEDKNVFVQKVSVFLFFSWDLSRSSDH